MLSLMCATGDTVALTGSLAAVATGFRRCRNYCVDGLYSQNPAIVKRKLPCSVFPLIFGPECP